MTRKSILKRKDYLNLLAKSKYKRRNALIDIADKQELNSLIELLINILHGRLELPKSKIKSLARYKNILRQLCQKRCGIKKKRRLLKQHGGFLSTILPIAISVLSGLFSK